jgi:hypothetical protein
VVWHGARVRVDVGRDEVTYSGSQLPDDGVEIQHGDEALLLKPDRSETRPLHRAEPLTPRPEQPPGREPIKATELG